MALSLASPGIKVREVDLTRGGITNTTSLSAGIAAPFAKGPINQVITIRNEDDLFSTFGKPSTNDYHYESWYSASNFLSYGGSLKVVRCGGTNLKNSNAGVGIGTTSIVINNYDEYQLTTPTTYYWASKNPGYWAEGVKVCVIDNFADQTLSGINTTTATVGFGVTQLLSGTIAGVGTTSVASGYLKGIIAGVGASTIYVKVNSIVVGATESIQDYTESGSYAFAPTSSLNIINASGVTTSTQTPTSVSDWYNSQNILDTANGDNTTISWRSVANKPRTNAYVSERGGGNDAFHVVVVDSKKVGNISGTPQNILEKFINLSKASDTLISPSQKVYYKDYLALNSTYIFAGKSIGDSADSYWRVTPVSSKLTSGGFVAISTTTGSWAQTAEGRYFNSVGNVSYTLTGGQDYSGISSIGGFQVSLNDISTAYDKLANSTEVSLNFLLQGSAGGLSKEEEQAKANKLISIAESRKDCVAFISPNRASVVNVTLASTQLSNVQAFFSPLTSSSYAVFDSGYQYVYDRFNQQFVYIPCSGDVAGLCVRTDIDQFPWYSPAGKSRGSLKFPIKLAYNPDQNARDQLYSQRINPIISSPGSGIILFGDKTALSYQSAFDRINVRRLFITIEQAIKGAADSQLFEFNDSTTRANFINIVEPYLRDVQIKRGITDFLLVCDETNNTPDVIDRSEFIADIYVKPARSINFIGLTFVATRTGVSFETVVGTV
jgi:phage tail sheath protein FI